MKTLEKPIAVYCICNAASLNIYKIQFGINNKVLAGLNSKVPRWHMVKYNENGEPYIIYGKIKYPLSEFMCI